MIHDYHYAWLIWSIGFLGPWAVLYIVLPEQRAVMWKTSLFMAPFGLTEPLFVPEYWNSPSLFDPRPAHRLRYREHHFQLRHRRHRRCAL